MGDDQRRNDPDAEIVSGDLAQRLFSFFTPNEHAYRLIVVRDVLHHPRLSPCNDGAAAQELPMNKIKNIALVAHDNRKRNLIEWVQWNYKADFIGSSKIE